MTAAVTCSGYGRHTHTGCPAAAAAARARASEPMHGAKLVLATIALSVGSFMNILDLSIANVSVPSIAGDLAVSPTQGTWVVTSYGVSEAILLPLTGWLAMRFGQVRMFVLATARVHAASFLCGISFTFRCCSQRASCKASWAPR